VQFCVIVYRITSSPPHGDDRCLHIALPVTTFLEIPIKKSWDSTGSQEPVIGISSNRETVVGLGVLKW